MSVIARGSSVPAGMDTMPNGGVNSSPRCACSVTIMYSRSNMRTALCLPKKVCRRQYVFSTASLSKKRQPQRGGYSRLRHTVILAAITAALAMGAEVPRPAPEFAVRMPDGTDMFLSHQRGKVVCLVFILTTCPHCQKLVATMSKLQPE